MKVCFKDQKNKLEHFESLKWKNWNGFILREKILAILKALLAFDANLALHTPLGYDNSPRLLQGNEGGQILQSMHKRTYKTFKMLQKLPLAKLINIQLTPQE